jgi:hypothetical protein
MYTAIRYSRNRDELEIAGQNGVRGLMEDSLLLPFNPFCIIDFPAAYTTIMASRLQYEAGSSSKYVQELMERVLRQTRIA